VCFSVGCGLKQVGIVFGYKVQEVECFIRIGVVQIIGPDGLKEDLIENVLFAVQALELYRIDVDKHILIFLNVELGHVDGQIVLDWKIQQGHLELVVVLTLQFYYLVENGMQFVSYLEECDTLLYRVYNLLDPLGQDYQLVKQLPNNPEYVTIQTKTVWFITATPKSKVIHHQLHQNV